MYIFAAGAGCMGTPKLVCPGDELIFTSSNIKTKPQVLGDEEPVEGLLNLTCSSSAGHSFHEPLPN